MLVQQILHVVILPSNINSYCSMHVVISPGDINSYRVTLPYLTLPPGWADSYTCPALRPYQLGPMRIPECNHKVTGSGYKAVDGCEAVNRRL